MTTDKTSKTEILNDETLEQVRGGSLANGFFAYDANFTGGVRVATGDVNNDATPEIITAAGPGGGPHVR
ncbi:MAG: hypothetical protein RIM84_16405 [Alphaproteobacteria bacterium]